MATLFLPFALATALVSLRVTRFNGQLHIAYRFTKGLVVNKLQVSCWKGVPLWLIGKSKILLSPLKILDQLFNTLYQQRWNVLPVAYALLCCIMKTNFADYN
jgi:hypothetical protein